jgi:hypothetical protein
MSFRKILFCSFVMGFASIPLVSGAMLKNGSFEEQGQESDRAEHWSRWGDWINRECSWAPTRDGACLTGYHHWQIEGKGNSGIWQDVVGVEAGAQVTFSVYANADRAEAGAQDFESVELRIETTIHGEQSVVASRRWPADAIATGSDWSRLFITTTIPKNPVRVVVIVTPGQGEKPRGGALKLDQAELAVHSSEDRYPSPHAGQ